MKEIKFRLFDKTMYYFDLDSLEDGIFFTGELDSHIVHTDDGPIMQFTGLFDKNNKEIFEGDIIACFDFEDKKFRHKVIKVLGAFGYMSYSEQFVPFAANQWFKWTNNQSDKIEVIGNIFENSELLKGSK